MAKFIGDLSACKTEGEQLVASMLKDRLPEDATIWGNVTLTVTEPNGTINDREIDLLFYVHGLGLFIVEIKDWRADQLAGCNRREVTFKAGAIKGNPFTDLANRCHCVMDALRASGVLDGAKRIPFPVTTMCCFPYITGDEWDVFFESYGIPKAAVGFARGRVICAENMGFGSKELIHFLREGRSVKFEDKLTADNAAKMNRLFGGEIGSHSAKFQLIVSSDFRESYQALLARGGVFQQAAQAMVKLITRKEAAYQLHEKPCRELEQIINGIAYRFGNLCELVTLHHGGNIYPIFAGTVDDVDTWADANSGLAVVINKETSRISLTRVNDGSKAVAIGESQAFTSENKPFFDRLEGFSLKSLGLKKLELKYFSELDENSDPEEIREFLGDIGDRQIAQVLADMITLLRKGDLRGAQAVYELFSEEASLAESDPALESEALESNANSDVICTLTDMGEGQLSALLDPTRFDDWILFLHPDQKKVVDCDSEKPMLITGVSGSGKTCILVHRARRLAQNNPDAKVGLLTLNRTLARFIKTLVEKLCTPEEASRIHCLAYYDYFKTVIEHTGADPYLDLYKRLAKPDSPLAKALENVRSTQMVRDVDPRSEEEIEDTWEETLRQQDRSLRTAYERIKLHLQKEHNITIDVDKYLQDELELIRTAIPLQTREDDYYQFPRSGRAIPFRRAQRLDILYILARFEEYMFAGGMMDVSGLTQILVCKGVRDALRTLPPQVGFTHLLVDEFQDFSTIELNILKAVPSAKKNSFCVAGDTAQKIYPKDLKMMSTGLIEGSAETFRIRKNFRNSKQILLAASKLSAHYAKIAKFQGVDIEYINPEFAERETAKPLVFKSSNEIEKAWECVEEWVGEGYSMSTACIATASPLDIGPEDILDLCPNELAAEKISTANNHHAGTVKVAELGDVKGFEFSLIVIVGCSSNQLPNPRLPEAEAWRDALRLYVAMTRGRDQVVLTYSGKPSYCLELMKDELNWADGNKPESAPKLVDESLLNDLRIGLVGAVKTSDK